MKKLSLLTLFLMLVGTSVFAQRNFFTPAPAGSLTQARGGAANVKNKAVFQLNELGMRAYLLTAPMEFKNNGRTVPLQIPFPDGTTETFKMVESPVLSGAQAALHPEIKTYTGNGTIDKKLVIRISFTSEGFNAIIINVKGSESIYIEKLSGNVYFIYFSRDIIEPQGSNLIGRPCGTPPATLRNPAVNTKPNGLPGPQNRIQSTGATLRTFRLAMSANGEYTAKHNGTVAGGFAGIVSIVNRLKAIYRQELAVDFTLVSGSNLVYTNAATDPFTGNDDGAMLTENQTLQDAQVGSANYDVGFVMGGNPAGTSPSGVAYLQSICDDALKAGGVANEGDGTIYSQLYSDKTLFHEMGHKFGMEHSYNSSIPVCTSRNPPTSVEPGSGATFMSYGFKCNDNTGNDDYFASTTIGLLLNFHSVSYDQAVAYMSTLVGGTSVATGNTAPVITMPTAYTIPKSTPFYLTGSASDAEGDALTYSWEGTNIGPATDPGPSWFLDPSKAPFFRSFAPVTTSTRYYPQLDSILNNNNISRANKLPSVSVATTHSLTVRDNNAAGGGVIDASVTINVNGAIGPFLETTNLSGTYNAGSSQTITWSVNSTNTATPNVNILLSTDGGNSFQTLVANTPNDGSQSVAFPTGITTSSARIKVEAVGNIFFDISNVNFKIQPFGVCATAGTVAGPASLDADQLGTFTETGGTNGLLQWKSATVSGGPYSVISGATTSNPASFSFATPGTYYVVLVRSVVGCADAVSNQLTVVVSRKGDKPCSPIALIVGFNSGLSNAGATTDAGEPIAPGGNCTGQMSWCDATISHTIWGTFTAPASGRVSVEASGFDTKIAVYAVSNCINYATYTLLGANDDVPGFGNSKINAVCLTPGSTYYVQLDGSTSGDVGNGNITITALTNAAPTFTGCPSNITITAACGSSTAVATWTPPTASDVDNCSPLVVTSNYSPGASFPVGTTTVTYTVSDGSFTSTCSFNVVITAVTYAITVNAGANGTITPASASYTCGSNQTFTITPNAGFSIQNVIVDGSSLGAISTYPFNNITGNHAISATFVANSVNLTINDITLNEGNSGTTSFTFTVSLSAPAPSGGVTFNIATANGTATAGSDYTASSATGTIAAGNSSTTFVVAVLGDVTFEPDETFFVNVTSATNAVITDAQGVGTITNDDAAPLPSLVVNNVALNEGNSGTTSFTFTVSLTAPAPTGGVTFNVATTNGTAIAGVDYVALTTTGFIAAGSTTTTFVVTVNGDVTFEPDETFFVNITNATNAVITDAQGLGTITNDDAAPLPNLTINDITLNEGNSGTTSFTFTASLSSPAPTGGVTFSVVTANGTATAGSDYTAASATGFIPAGSSTYNFTVLVNGDATFEPTETFFVNITSPTNAVITDGQGVGTITNDDAAPLPNLTINDVTQVEGNSGTSAFTFTVSLSAPSASTVTFSVATSNGTATSGTDYIALTTTFTIPPGNSSKTVVVMVNGDVTIEGDETFNVNITTPTNAVISDGIGLGTITNDDVAPLPNLTITDVLQTEGNSGTTAFTFTVNLSTPAPAGGVSFDIATANNTAIAPGDYTAKSLTTQTIPAGSSTYSFTVLVNGDVTVEPMETFFVNVTNATNAVITDAQGMGTITNDDVAPYPNLTITDVTQVEGNSGTSAFTFTVNLSTPAQTGGVSFNVATANGTATAGSDYVALATTGSIAAGSSSTTVVVTVNGDVTIEPTETFFVNVTNVINAVISDAQGMGTITNDDADPCTTDNQPPSIPSNITAFLNASGNKTLLPADVAPFITDNCAVNPNSITVSANNFTCANINTGGPHQAYIANTSTGNQAFRGEMGMDFTVNNANGIQVNQLGAFDHQGNGINGTQSGGVRVAIFNKATQTMVPGLNTIITGSTDPLVANHRMKNIPPVTLMPGNYVIVAKGYSAAELNGNVSFGGGPFAVGDNGSGAITYTNRISWGSDNAATSFVYPPFSTTASTNEYLAGSFNYAIGSAATVNSVTISASDMTGNNTTVNAIVTVVDTFYTIVTRNITVNLDASGHATIQPSDVLVSLKNNCGATITSSTLQVTPSSFDCSNVNGAAAIDRLAYVSNTATGNQSYLGEVGMDFTVNTAGGIQVNQLGAFDHLANGISGTQSGGVRVAIFNKATQTIVPGLDIVIVGNADGLVANHRMKNITPVTLLPGNYVIVAKGYSATERNGNAGLGGGPFANGDNGGGAITYNNRISWGANNSFPSFGYPPNSQAGSTNEYHAGTFNYFIPPVAATTVTLKATDMYGTVDFMTAMVTVVDNLAPVLPTNLTVALDASGHGSVTPAAVASLITDNCQVNASSITVSPNSFDCASVGGVAAPHQAYVSNTATGNQSYLGEVGMDFTVNTAGGIQINQLGAFDHQANGISGTQSGGVRVAIFNRTTQTIVPGLNVVISGSADPLVANHRMRSITPVTLMPGNYVIIAKGYNAAEMNGNAGVSGGPFANGDNGGGVIAYTNRISWGANNSSASFGYPPNSQAGSTNEYHAGTFNYTIVPITTVTISASDISGNVSQVTANVTVTDPNHSCSSAPAQVIAGKVSPADQPTALTAVSKLEVYPNPTSGVFNVLLSHFSDAKINLEITDQNGKLVAVKALTLSSKTPVLTVPFDLSSKASGMYVIRAVSATGIQTAKLLIQR